MEDAYVLKSAAFPVHSAGVILCAAFRLSFAHGLAYHVVVSVLRPSWSRKAVRPSGSTTGRDPLRPGPVRPCGPVRPFRPVRAGAVRPGAVGPS